MRKTWDSSAALLLAAATFSVAGCGKDTAAPQSLAQALSMSPTGSLTMPRELHTATLLNTGKVLVAGGLNLVTFPLAAELFDPVTGTFTTTGSLGAVHHTATATLLKNGMVLVAGGEGGAGRPRFTPRPFNTNPGPRFPARKNKTGPRFWIGSRAVGGKVG